MVLFLSTSYEAKRKSDARCMKEKKTCTLSLFSGCSGERISHMKMLAFDKWVWEFCMMKREDNPLRGSRTSWCGLGKGYNCVVLKSRISLFMKPVFYLTNLPTVILTLAVVWLLSFTIKRAPYWLSWHSISVSLVECVCVRCVCWFSSPVLFVFQRLIGQWCLHNNQISAR